MKEISRSRASLESETDPAVRKKVLEKIRRKELELEAHDKAKPIEKPNPAAAASIPQDETILEALKITEELKNKTKDNIAKNNEILRNAERRFAVAVDVLEKIENFRKDFEAFKISMDETVNELGLKTEDLVTLSFKSLQVEKIRDEAANTVEITKKVLDNKDPPGLQQQLATIEGNIATLQSKLDAPQQEYQAYIKEFEEWQRVREAIVGGERDPESLDGLKVVLANLDNLPEQISKLRTQQIKIAVQIHTEKLGQVAIYQELYGPVQTFIDSHKLAKDKLKLEFTAELSNQDFSDRLLGLLSLNRRGSFMGVEDGHAKSESFVKVTIWNDLESVKSFLEKVDKALHQDQREKQPPATQLKDQILKGKDPSEVFDMLYGLEYLRPKYVLRWEGKDLTMLSPGERGTLLLVFYLLIQKGDMPIIIDQPEGNLDNYTIAKVLVDCIKAARNDRQVFIVTHNPNLAVVCDADQIIYANMDKANGNAITYITGALENPIITKHVTDVLEGTRWAFNIRGSKYDVTEGKMQA